MNRCLNTYLERCSPRALIGCLKKIVPYFEFVIRIFSFVMHILRMEDVIPSPPSQEGSVGSAPTSKSSSVCSKSLVVYCCQVFVMVVVIVVSMCNLSFGGPDKEMWITLLCSTLGYLLPNPSIKRVKKPSMEL